MEILVGACGTAAAVAGYASSVHGASFDDYVAALKQPLDSSLPIINDYEWALINNGRTPAVTRTTDAATGQEEATKVLMDNVEANEAARMEAYFISAGKSVVQVSSPIPVAEQKEFLGYTFSERKQHEGISLLSGTAIIDTPLFDPTDPNNPSKISTFIKNQFETPVNVVPDPISQYTSVLPLADLVGLKDMIFQWSLSGRLAEERPFLVPTERLGTLCEMAIGGTPSKAVPQYFRGTNPWLSVKDMTGDEVFDTTGHITDAAVTASNAKLVRKGTLLLSYKLSIGKTAIAGIDMYTNEAIVALTPRPRPKPSNAWVDTAYLHTLFRFFADDILQHTDKAYKKFGQSLNLAFLRRVEIPLVEDATRNNFVQIANDSSIDIAERRKQLRAMLWGL